MKDLERANEEVDVWEIVETVQTTTAVKTTKLIFMKVDIIWSTINPSVISGIKILIIIILTLTGYKDRNDKVRKYISLKICRELHSENLTNINLTSDSHEFTIL